MAFTLSFAMTRTFPYCDEKMVLIGVRGNTLVSTVDFPWIDGNALLRCISSREVVFTMVIFPALTKFAFLDISDSLPFSNLFYCLDGLRLQADYYALLHNRALYLVDPLL